MIPRPVVVWPTARQLAPRLAANPYALSGYVDPVTGAPDPFVALGVDPFSPYGSGFGDTFTADAYGGQFGALGPNPGNLGTPGSGFGGGFGSSFGSPASAPLGSSVASGVPGDFSLGSLGSNLGGMAAGPIGTAIGAGFGTIGDLALANQDLAQRGLPELSPWSGVSGFFDTLSMGLTSALGLTSSLRDAWDNAAAPGRAAGYTDATFGYGPIAMENLPAVGMATAIDSPSTNFGGIPGWSGGIDPTTGAVTGYGFASGPGLNAAGMGAGVNGATLGDLTGSADNGVGAGADNFGGSTTGDTGAASDNENGGGFMRGGYTGAGWDGVVQPNRPAGTVHEGELVLPAHLLAQLGGPQNVLATLAAGYGLQQRPQLGGNALAQLYAGSQQRQGTPQNRLADILREPRPTPVSAYSNRWGDSA